MAIPPGPARRVAHLGHPSSSRRHVAVSPHSAFVTADIVDDLVVVGQVSGGAERHITTQLVISRMVLSTATGSSTRSSLMSS